MKKLIFLTVLTLMIFSLCPHAYSQHKLSGPPKSNNYTNGSKKSVRVSEPDGYVNGHGYVDLGLPSGLKWAVCNVGASSPQEYGNYYAWGETTPKSNYDWSNCFDCLDNNGNSWNTYKIGGKTQISATSGHDTARENWGGSWCMPTDVQFQELCDKCTWKWTTLNGKKGYKVTGPNKKSIFLPVAGYRYGAESYDVGSRGNYWSSTLSSDCSFYARDLLSGGSYHYTYDNSRSYGFSVRPVTK